MAQIGKHLRREDASVGSKGRGKAVFPPQRQIRQDLRSDHGSAHTPEIEAGGNVNLRQGRAVCPDIGYAVQTDAVLIGPGELLSGLREMLFGKGPRYVKAAAPPACTAVSLPHQQKIFVVSQIHAACRRVFNGAAQLRPVFQGDHK